MLDGLVSELIASSLAVKHDQATLKQLKSDQLQRAVSSAVIGRGVKHMKIFSSVIQPVSINVNNNRPVDLIDVDRLIRRAFESATTTAPETLRKWHQAEVTAAARAKKEASKGE